VKIAQLLDQVPGLSFSGDSGVSFSKVTVDSRQASNGFLFIAVIGSFADGHDYIEAAAANGCAGMLVQSGACSLDSIKTQFPNLPILTAVNTRPMPALIAKTLAGNPDLGLMTAGVTGTNGKTTVSYLLQQMLQQLNGPCGLLGTIRYDSGNESIAAPLTTPDGTVFYHWLKKMVDAGCQSVAMEVSSHALDQERTAGLNLNVAIMTNLGRDHLDYHQDLPTYLAAKAKIMSFLNDESTGQPGTLIINVGDSQLAALDTGNHRVLRFVASEKSKRDTVADLKVIKTRLTLSGTKIILEYHGKKIEINSPLVGRFNVENLTASLAAGIALGFDPEAVSQALTLVPQVPGRLERFLLPNGALAVVDYAHTHDALEAVLLACRELTEGRLTVVFGCGGDRDKGKRPLMGAVAARDSDCVWITSDNPRTEEPGQICNEIKAGFMGTSESLNTPCQIVVNRKDAIEAALVAADSGDIVVVAGKGHEDYQLIGDQVLSLDDRKIIRDWISRDDNHVH